MVLHVEQIKIDENKIGQIIIKWIICPSTVCSEVFPYQFKYI